MGIDYLVCTECGNAFPDVIDYRICEKCEGDICTICSEALIKKYGFSKNAAFLEDWAGEIEYEDGEIISDYPASCSKCAGDVIDDTVRVDYLCKKYVTTRSELDIKIKEDTTHGKD